MAGALRFTVEGQPPSKSNSYRVVRVAGHGSLAKTRQLHDYEAAFARQCPASGPALAVPFVLEADIWFASARPDLDNALKVLLDCLQACGVVANDRLCVGITARKHKDAARPRAELTITPME